MSKTFKFMGGGCPANISEEMTVTVPVTVHAFSNIGKVSFSCVGHPELSEQTELTPCNTDAISRFTVNQQLHVDIPVSFGAEVDIGDGCAVYDAPFENRCQV